MVTLKELQKYSWDNLFLCPFCNGQLIFTGIFKNERRFECRNGYKLIHKSYINHLVFVFYYSDLYKIDFINKESGNVFLCAHLGMKQILFYPNGRYKKASKILLEGEGMKIFPIKDYSMKDIEILLNFL